MTTARLPFQMIFGLVMALFPLVAGGGQVQRLDDVLVPDAEFGRERTDGIVRGVVLELAEVHEAAEHLLPLLLGVGLRGHDLRAASSSAYRRSRISSIRKMAPASRVWDAQYCIRRAS